ncbi:unnamed protein product [Ceutorhynchus assimilis]|uniref:Piezo non-specific cation channel cap domain-containing protein n=1 Tax=Ceutorhynchus assimilis TaxID=467358 RepID=A0A9P0DL10_9CUCU|nr:unnamed protein product [Ceutorhynchus assimilis]
MYVLLILTIIFPFLLFSFSSTISKATYPKRITMELYIGRAQPAFMAVASTEKMLVLEKKQYKNLTSTFNNIEVSQDIFGSFYAEDVLVVKWSTHSLTIWDISPGSREELLEELRSNEDFIVRLEISYIHIGDGGKTSERSFGKSTIIPPLPALDRKRLIQMVETDTDTQTVVRLPLLFPKFLLIKKDSLPESLPLMEDPNKELQGFDQKDNKEMLPDPRRMRNLLVRLNANDSKWWQMREECSINDDNYLYYLKDLVLNDCDEIVLYVFNEKVLPGTFLKMVQYGILGLYIIYFMVIVEIIKSLITKIDDIWLLNLPDVDKVLRKCMEVYVVRDMKNYELESALFDELIYIMRSRETLIKLTRYEDSDYDPTFITPGSSMN